MASRASKSAEPASPDGNVQVSCPSPSSRSERPRPYELLLMFNVTECSTKPTSDLLIRNHLATSSFLLLLLFEVYLPPTDI